MSALTPRDPLPGRPLIYRIDTRNGRDTLFWCRVRQAFLPKLKGHVFWVSDEPAEFEMPEDAHCIVLPRPLLLQYVPEYVRLSVAEREHMRRFCQERDKTFRRNLEVVAQLRGTGLVRGRTITTKGLNSYHLSP